ncbi:MAG: malate dehydrogenase (quinone) [Oxalicibacterium faecigallinarum]|uniref:Probable malate:quinone oxidoreductase n=1 Tax=Oxalicibacterium faecigallinarum TaxID=573741 RepID=A0A8J3AQ70_9BURK|nr:malate dehydrogenase (quinone) [Oxalicibacterium faecigallinarum]MDQ7968095.1 malate dehydrogenase (quinone) [Oxalicibacterium faecigallinarum]GGI19366.1 putative malate:quinone oxidoreductase [Oxalicibacterium faecigallinarum]
MKTIFKTLFGLLLILVIAAALFLYWPLFPKSHPAAENDQPVDAVMIGGGVMSTTLATYLQELEPDWKIEMYERMDGVALESSNGWNNAGTGHSGFAELNYTPELPDGSIETKRAVNIAEQFEVSRQFFAHQVKAGRLGAPSDFINPTPHMSFVWGDDNIAYLKKRHAALIKNPLFYGMQYSEDAQQIAKWAPLMMEGRDPAQKIAATYMPLGTDVNFGVITNQLITSLQRSPNFKLHLSHEVRGLHQNDDKTWNVTVYDLKNNTERTIKSKFVFIGAGGASLKLLQASGIPESKDYAGFPVGGQFLAFQSPAIADRHDVKAYGKAEAGSPPMSVPHLDARKLDGKPVVLFGPFALQSTKFLKEGSWFDLFSSVTHDNVFGMLRVGSENLDLVKYLAQQAALSDDDRHKELLKYFPQAKREDWKLVTAGQRVQVIKRDKEKGAILQFGTEVVTDKDGTIAALLGASPGASTAPPIMLTVLSKAFPQEMAASWETRLKDIIPSYGKKLNDSPALTNEIRRFTSATLHLPYLDVPGAGEPEPVSMPDEKPSEDRVNKAMQAL